jgi:hypothetical protein
VLQYIINLYTLSKEHLWWSLTKWFRKQISRFKSSLIQHIQRFKDIVRSTQNQPMETIQAFVQHPSADKKYIKFAIYKDRQNAIAEAKGITSAMYTDRLRRNELVEIAVV